jgi:hypothetical protein
MPMLIAGPSSEIASGRVLPELAGSAHQHEEASGRDDEQIWGGESQAFLEIGKPRMGPVEVTTRSMLPI